jgi:hypothetical protein
MSDLTGKAKENMHKAADAAKKAANTIVDNGKNVADEAVDAVKGKSKDMAHKAGKKMEEVGKHLQDA